MADNAELERLHMRITELENTLKKLSGERQSANVTSEEMQTYLKVRQAVEVDFCGVNDCMVLRCISPCVTRCVSVCITRCITVCITRCINECVCGPCACRIPGGTLGSGFDEMGD